MWISFETGLKKSESCIVILIRNVDFLSKRGIFKKGEFSKKKGNFQKRGGSFFLCFRARALVKKNLHVSIDMDTI